MSDNEESESQNADLPAPEELPPVPTFDEEELSRYSNQANAAKKPSIPFDLLAIHKEEMKIDVIPFHTF